MPFSVRLRVKIMPHNFSSTHLCTYCSARSTEISLGELKRDSHPIHLFIKFIYFLYDAYSFSTWGMSFLINPLQPLEEVKAPFKGRVWNFVFLIQSGTFPWTCFIHARLWKKEAGQTRGRMRSAFADTLHSCIVQTGAGESTCKMYSIQIKLV